MSFDRYQQRLLAVKCEGDGPWVRVRDVKRLSLQHATMIDVVEIDRRGHDFNVPRDPIRIQGSSTVDVLITEEELRVRRVAGTNPVTVIAWCPNVTPTERQSDRRSHRGNGYETDRDAD